MIDRGSLRAVSAKLFGNEKAVEVIRGLASESNTGTAQQVSRRTGIDHSMVRDVLVRLADAGLVRTLPRASSRAPQYYEANPDDPVWVALVRLADAVFDSLSDAKEQPDQLGSSTEAKA